MVTRAEPHGGQWTLLIALLGCLAGPWPAAAAPNGQALETIELHHALAQDVLPVIRPLLPAGSGLSAQGNRLFLRTDPGTLAQIKGVIAQLDRAPVSLMISVRNTQRETAQGSGYSVSGQVKKGDTRISVGHPRGADLRITAGEHRYSTDRDQVSQVRGVEGQPAFIATGQTVPYYAGRWYLYGPGVSFQELEQGFYAVPHLRGDRVTLDIRPRSDRLSSGTGGAIDRQSVVTTVSGRLGEWITIAGTDRRLAQERSGILYRTTRSSPEERLIQVKVDRLD